MNESLIISKKIEGNKVILVPVGSINNNTAKILSDELQNLNYTNLDLTIDLSKTDYITSAGLRVLLVARKKLSDETMRVLNANESIVEIFSITGFDSFIKLKNEAAEEENDDLSYSALLSLRVKNNKDKAAYIYKEKEYTWEEVDIASSIIAKDLASFEVKKGTHVGICGANSINWIFTFFAIQKLGGVAVLINPKLKPEEVRKICEIGGVSHLCFANIPGITTFDLYKDICLKGNDVKHVIDISESVDFLSRRNEFTEIENCFRENHHADDASIIIFTSGSTGKPKAVLSSAYSISSSVSSIINNFKFTDKDINLAFLPLFHIFGLETNIVIGLLKGYCSIIPSEIKPKAMIELIEKYKCTIFNTVPTMMLGMVAHPLFSSEKLSSLRVSVLGGSTTTGDQMAMLMKLLPNTHFANIYGMSENASIAITDYDETVEHLTKTVGKPVHGMKVCIRNNEGFAVENGEIGEIFIKSDSMLVCYYKLDVDEQPIDDEGWLSTGDLGFIDEDGYIRLTGRAKDLIISGGENISPGEVNEVIAGLPCVKESKIIGIPDDIRGEVVCAAIVLKDGFEWNENEVRETVSKSLAHYKQPTYYVLLSNFPLLGSGKIDSISLKQEVLKRLNLQ